MKNVLVPLLLGCFLLGAAGCGGGGEATTTEITPARVAGETQRTWRVVAIRGNSSFTGGGVDTPCPAALPRVGNPSSTFSCGANDTIQIRANGSFTYRGAGVSWTLEGSTVTLNLGSALGIITASLTVEPVAAGAPQRLRVHQISRVVGGVRNTNEDGTELVLEEIALG